jgi:hypothetical protein
MQRKGHPRRRHPDELVDGERLVELFEAKQLAGAKECLK